MSTTASESQPRGPTGGARRERRVTRRRQEHGDSTVDSDERRRRGGWWWLLPLLLLLALIAVGIAALAGAFHTAKKHHRAAAVTPSSAPAPAATAPTTAPATSAPTTAPPASGTSPASTAPPVAGSSGAAGPVLVGGGAVTPRVATGTLAAAGTVGAVLFAENSTVLDPDAHTVITRAAANLRAGHAKTVNVIGYTDTDGNTAANDQLSLQRAQVVKSALQQQLGAGVSVNARAEGQADEVATTPPLPVSNSTGGWPSPPPQVAPAQAGPPRPRREPPAQARPPRALRWSAAAR
jgi:outer membrane protein OmpA-like peptidoglycan-associated protein